jgi:hypothetical protein
MEKLIYLFITIIFCGYNQLTRDMSFLFLIVLLILLIICELLKYYKNKMKNGK